MPKRIQRKRTKGWRMPNNAVYVGRPTKWGNPWKAGDTATSYPGGNSLPVPFEMNLVDTIRFHKSWLKNNPASPIRDISELKGKDLACWCPLDQPCHADVLLELANPLDIDEQNATA